MKNKLFLTGMLVLALVFGMMVVGCDDGSTDGNTGSNTLAGTTWIGHYDNLDITLTFSGSNGITYSTTNAGGTTTTSQGTYSISGSTVTVTIENWTPQTATISGNKLTFTANPRQPLTKQ
jgi:hypothetical protein